MTRILAVFFCFALLASCSAIPATTQTAKDFFPGIAAQQYVQGTEDLPLYDGFKAAETQNISFDTTNGRIVDATFYSKRAVAEDVRTFYDTTLPQLGWQKQQYQIYRRDGETLKLTILQEGGKVVLRFIIQPGT